MTAGANKQQTTAAQSRGGCFYAAAAKLIHAALLLCGGAVARTDRGRNRYRDNKKLQARCLPAAVFNAGFSSLLF